MTYTLEHKKGLRRITIQAETSAESRALEAGGGLDRERFSLYKVVEALEYVRPASDGIVEAATRLTQSNLDELVPLTLARRDLVVLLLKLEQAMRAAFRLFDATAAYRWAAIANQLGRELEGYVPHELDVLAGAVSVEEQPWQEGRE